MAKISTFSFKNPLPDYCNDERSLRLIIQNYKLWPRRGTTASSQHAFTELCDFLHQNSASFKAILEDKKAWTFGNAIDVVPHSRPFLKKESQQLGSEDLKEQFYDFYEEKGLTFESIIAQSKAMYTNEHVDGNAYLRYREVEVGGEKRVSTSVINPKCLMKVVWDKEDNVDYETCVISNNFTNLGRHNAEIDVVNIYPKFSSIPGGRETIFHFRDDDCTKVYNESKCGNSLYWQFVQWAASDLACKVTGTATVTKNILFYKHEPLDADIGGDNNTIDQGRAMAIALKNTMSRDGTAPKEIALLGYPEERPSLEKVDVNRNEKWLDTIMEISNRQILQSLRWSGVVSGLEKPSAGIGGNTIVDEMRRVKGVVNGDQDMYEARWAKVFSVANEFLDPPQELRELNIQFPDKLSEAIDQYDEKEITQS